MVDIEMTNVYFQYMYLYILYINLFTGQDMKTKAKIFFPKMATIQQDEAKGKPLVKFEEGH